MAIDVQAIICPQCGAGNIDMTSENQGTCKSCGAQVTVQPRIETQNIYINTEPPVESSATKKDDSCTKTELVSEYTKDQFIRKVWIELAKEDAPLEIFSLDFTPVSENEHEIFVDSLSVDVSYQASVGHDRQEPYIDYEDYWEDIPYVVIEQKYNGITQKTENVEVTKYKKVKKQRQVTKYKKVTDWRPLSGTHHTKSIAVVENKEGQYFDRYLFVGSFRGAKDDSFVMASAELAKQMQISNAAQSAARAEHRNSINSSVKNSLPGDHSKDLDWNITKVTDSALSLYKASEYETSILFNGKTYVRRAFPFGSMMIGGDQIKNEVSLDATKRKMREELKAKNEARKNAIEPNVIKATNGISLITIAALVTSILVSLFVRSTALILLMFAVAVASFVFNTIKVKNETEAETKRSDAEIAATTAEVEEEIVNYSENYNAKKRKILDDKLTSLGYKPVTAEEL